MRRTAACVAVCLALWGCSDSETNGNVGGSNAGGANAGGGGVGGSNVGGSGGAGGSTGTGGTGGVGGQGTGGAGGESGFGTLTGDCGEIDPAELMAMSAPFELVNTIDFGMATYSRDVLSEGGQTLFDDPNAGGSSKESEIMAFEVLHRCELAALLKTETEIVYDAVGSITDMLVEIDGLKTGVSVVRAFKFMGDYTEQDALDKMTEKLADIQESTANVSAPDAWGKQILHVLAEKPENAVAVEAALPQVPAGTRGDTIVVITITNGDDAFIY